MLRKRISTLITTAAVVVAATMGGTNAFAAGTGVQNIGGPTTVNNGADASFTVSLSSLSGVGGGGVQGYNGTFVFDSAYWTYKSFTSKAPFGISFNEVNGKFIGAGMSPFAATSSDMFTIVLTAKQTGTTSISMTSTKVVDGNADPVTMTAASAKSVTISTPPVLSSNNNLSALSVSGYSIIPAFSSSVTSYTLTVPNTASSVTVNATKEDAAATMTGAGNKTLTVGPNTVNVVVTAENGTPKTYSIVITREAAPIIPTPPPTSSSDATLKSLDVSGYTLTPAFNKNTTNYTITVQPSINGLNVTAIPNEPHATVVVSGNTGWDEGTNNITIKVTAEDGSVKTYIVTVKRPGNAGSTAKSSNNYLKSLDVKTYPINFNKNTNSYSLTVPYEVDKLDLSALSEDDKAKVKIIGNSDLKVGAVNIIEIEVTAEDGSLRIYTINVTRSSIVSKTKLANLEVKNHTISPKFDPEIEEYSLTVPYSVTDLDVIYKTSDKDAKVSITGDKNLKVGNNVVLVKVTDANGFTRTYIINVEREAGMTIFGMNPFLFFGLLGLLLLGLIILFILLAKRRKKDERPIEPEPRAININVNPSFTPDVNIGSKNNSDFATDDAKLIRGDDNANEISEGQSRSRKAVDAVITDVHEPDADSILDDSDDNLISALMGSLKVGMKDDKAADKYDIDELMNALKNGDGSTVKMFIKQIKADDLKDELRGLDPDRYDDMFDDHPTVHEVVRAMEDWQKTGSTKELAMLIDQYEANKLRQKIEKGKR